MDLKAHGKLELGQKFQYFVSKKQGETSGRLLRGGPFEHFEVF